MQNKSTIAYLSKQYIAVLKKCLLICAGTYLSLGATNSKAAVTTFEDLKSSLTSGGTIDVDGDITFTSSISAGVNSVVNGNNNSFLDGLNAKIIVGAGDTLTLNNLIVENFETTLSGTASDGAFLYNGTTSVLSTKSTVNINNSKFFSNTTSTAGGALRNSESGTMNIIGSTFQNNVGGSYGSADISNSGSLYIENSTFLGGGENGNPSNHLDNSIGNIQKVTIISSSFENYVNNNTNTGNGGAFNNKFVNSVVYEALLSINIGSTTTTTFKNNSAYYGGAIYNDNSSTINVNNTTFESNNAVQYGGAIFNQAAATISNSSFVNNTANNGGAIWNSSELNTNAENLRIDTILNIVANTANVVFKGNTANGISNAIYNDETVNFNSSSDYQIQFYDGLSGDGVYNLQTGTLALMGENAGFADNSNLNVFADAIISTIDGVVRTTSNNPSFGKLTTTGDIGYGIDVDLFDQTGDSLNAETITLGGKITITNINILKDTDTSSTAPIGVYLENADVVKNAIELGDITISKDASVSADYNFISYDEASQFLGVEVKTLHQAVTEETGVRAYTLIKDEVVSAADAELGSMLGDAGASLTIAGHNFQIVGGGDKSGIIINANQTLNVTNVSNFTGFNSTNGGAIYNSGTASFDNVNFSNNIATTNGGAIYNAGTITNISGNFVGNYASSTSQGGAIYNAATGIINSISGTFEDNHTRGSVDKDSGGAIYNAGTIKLIINSSFSSDYNISGTYYTDLGGAIYNSGIIEAIVDTSFIGNYVRSGNEGGAIYNTGTLSLIANEEDVLFQNNFEGSIDNAIYNTGTINMYADSNVANDGRIIFDDAITGDNGIININSGDGSVYAGTVEFNEAVSGNAFNIFNGLASINNTLTATSFNGAGGTIGLINSNLQNINLGDVSLTGNVNLELDVNFDAGTGDLITSSDNAVSGDGIISITKLNLLTEPNSIPDMVDVINGAITSKVELDTRTVTLTGLENADSFLVSYTKNDITFINDLGVSAPMLAGSVLININGINAAVALDIDQKAYYLRSDEKATKALADLMGTELSVDGKNNKAGATSNYKILGEGFGGVIVSANQELNLKSIADVSGFNSTDGGFIYNSSVYDKDKDFGGVQIVDTSFSGNSATGLGGVIYNIGTVEILTNVENVLFDDNADSSGDNAIYNAGTLNLSANNSKTITFNDAISGSNGIINITGTKLDDASEIGKVIFNQTVSNNKININSGYLQLGVDGNINGLDVSVDASGVLDYSNNGIKDVSLGDVSGPLSLGLDLNLATPSADVFSANSVSGELLISKLYITSDATTIPLNVKIIDGVAKNALTSFAGLEIINGGATHDYSNGYLIGYSNESDGGYLSLALADFETALNSNIDIKAYTLSKDETLPVDSFNGNNLTLNGGGYSVILGEGSQSNLAINNSQTLNLENIGIDASISGDGILNLNDATSTSTVALNGDLSGFSGEANLDGGTLKLGSNANFFGGVFNISNTPTLNVQNGITSIYDTQNWNLSSNLNVMIDVDLVGETADSFTNFNSGQTINISGIKLLSEKQGETIVSVTNNSGIGGNFTIDSNLLKITDPIYIYKYMVDSSKLASNGELIFSDGTIIDFNPEVQTESVSTQAIYSSNLDLAKQMLAALDAYSPIQGRATGDEESQIGGAWVKVYGSDEDVDLGNLNVHNQTYAGILGVDAKPEYYSNGTRGIYSLYLAYLQSEQEYDGINIEQNGINFGARAMFDKGDWYGGAVANVGLNLVEGTNSYGRENFETYTLGLSVKTGYDINLYCQKYIMQPNVTMSYLYAYTPNYTNAADIRIKSDALHALNINPELKFIAHMDNGYSPYASFGYNWNVETGGDITADNAALPDLSVDPYAEFKLGFTKATRGDMSGYVEGFATTGGRQGYGAQAGLKWEF